MHSVQNITPQEYAAIRADEQAPRPVLIDVREPWEFGIARLEEAKLLPLGQIHEWSQTLDKNASYVIMCHHGSRSAMACQLLQRAGFKNVRNLDGGIHQWSFAVDPKIARY